MSYIGQKARKQPTTANAMLSSKFQSLGNLGQVSAQYVGNYGSELVVGVAGLKFEAPLVMELMNDEAIGQLVLSEADEGKSVLFKAEGNSIKAYEQDASGIKEIQIDSSIKDTIQAGVLAANSWGGMLNGEGELVADPSTPAPGPHYYTNLLIGNRIESDRPLQSTPKSAIDTLGGGCFRAHADTQVLATKWDYLPEENGFPANRQFYITENGKQIFYSGEAKAQNLVDVKSIHSQNHTDIYYTLKDGLKIKRTIFILPAIDKLPLATEAQMIEITNEGASDRNLRIVCTGMFGTSEVHALREDIIFTTVVAESEVFIDDKSGEIKAFGFDPNPKWTKGNIRYATVLVHDDEGLKFPSEFCARYSEFVGNGTLAKPQFVSFLSNKHSRKGPGFFALATSFVAKKGSTVQVDSFACLSSDAVNEDYKEGVTAMEEMNALIERFSDRNELPETFASITGFTEKYASYMQIKHDDKNFEAYVNRNLPFQVFYQTFVSRSLDWTQKGYREIGFREIQDIFASMYYFAGMGKADFVKKLITEWIENVYEDGYANHNFYWKGKEPGKWSDDALWLLQALDRYVNLTGDYEFIKTEFKIAGTEGKKRTVLETIKAILTYSAFISVGKHGLPLIDMADWNDCLRMDPDFIDGPTKIAKYKEQIASSEAKYGEVAFESEYSESIMNGFLLKTAVDCATGLFEKCGDKEFSSKLVALSSSINEKLQKDAWKGDFFARVLFNRSNKPELSYLGAGKDGLSAEGFDGSYYLNTFSWSVLSDCATETQISIMLDSMEKYLKTPYGYRLCSSVEYSKIAPKIDVALYYAGDRENGGVFKHANMMCAAAMLRAVKQVKDDSLARRLTNEAYWIIDCILPYKTLEAPFLKAGNPRLCTQYNNCETGENIGPTLSGTSTWLLLCLFTCFGVNFTSDCLTIEPILRENETKIELTVKSGKADYHIIINKEVGFKRAGSNTSISCDGVKVDSLSLPIFSDGEVHEVVVNI